MEIDVGAETGGESQYVVQKNGISMERVVNLQNIEIIQDLIKCSICLDILCKPYECEICGSLFCEDCIKDWTRIKQSCPMKCNEFKISKAKVNTRKLLNILVLRCINYPDCDYQCNYWQMFEHESKCSFQKIKCPNHPCDFAGCFNDLKHHLISDCQFLFCECKFCNSKIQRSFFEDHLYEHYINKTFSIENCSKCDSNENLRRCICKKPLCYKCLRTAKNIECLKSCYLFHTGLKTTNTVYNISKFPLPLNFEAKILFTSVDWIRTGITFDKHVIDDQVDMNCPSFDIYCILEDLVQFYSMDSGWKNCFPKDRRPLKPGDYMTISLKNGEMRFYVNDFDLGSTIKINMINKKEMYLFVHCRNEKSRAEIIYISEIFN